MAATAVCPECDAEIEVAGVEVGEIAAAVDDETGGVGHPLVVHPGVVRHHHDGVHVLEERLGELAGTLADPAFQALVGFLERGVRFGDVEVALAQARADVRQEDQQHAGNEERFELITFNNAFHGRTMATISASSQEKMHQGFAPLLPGFRYAEFNDLDAARAAIGPHTAGFLVEPIQGEGGIRVGTPEFITGLRQLADEHDLMLVFDEVQTGVARTGTFYAHEQYGIDPDILATAKGIGGGFPLGACLATEKAARGMTFGTHGSTYGGNPLAMAAGNAVLDAVANDEFLAGVRAKGERIRSRLKQFIGNYPELFEEVRGKGLMIGVKLKVEPRGFMQHLRDRHQLLTVAAGDGTLRLLPPLVIEDAEIDEFFDKLSAGASDFPAPEPGQ